ncbi:ClC family H(+)/Cl(-) exchange transporter [Anaerotalea alkaliphila]|uniref:ClC family H(+)/Cl(-) exchange transporter n=1 Tax=Anaerotalea alkaliphila TaxID=2662126 RepID=A0A7X5HVM7_9FIRM|nr:ClC family H(+)/Cl(-) exchange transporter [Anaerotalea alkaliphila]NDL67485.1 ClC family H(+)/Cl(-) exchange transporter [Anaerotalea alkaliphila]
MKNNLNSMTSHDYRKIPLVLASLAVGLVAGAVVVLYRIVLGMAEEFAFAMYGFFKTHMGWIPLLFGGLVLLGFIVSHLVAKNRMISGSGIPQLKGIILGYFQQRWLHTVVMKFIGGTLAIAGGLSLGREGPSIQLGASVAEGLGNKVGRSRMERKILMASGASAGLAAAFNAPLAGVLFALEEIFKYFSPLILLSTMAAAVVAEFVSKQVFGFEPVFHFALTKTMPLENYWMLVVMGGLLGLLGAFYNRTLLQVQSLYKKNGFLTERNRIVLPFLLAGVLGLAFPIVLGGGHRIVEQLNLENGLGLLLLIFTVKFGFSMVSFGSGAPGGIFLPLLVLGSVQGAMFATVAIRYLGVDPALFHNFVIFAMGGYFAAIVRAPITGIVLILEMTGSLHHLLALSIVSMTAYIAADLMKSLPIYDSLLDRLVSDHHIQEEEEHSHKVIVEIVVQHGSSMEDKAVSAIPWPKKCLLVSVKRGEKEILPRGNTVLKAGDYLFVLTDINSEWLTRKTLEELNAY